MNIVQITPGTGGMYCGNCLRDNALVKALRQLGHQVLMVPLYLPLTLDEDNQTSGTPIFFGGINVYLEQKSALFRNAPEWLHRWLSSPGLLQWAAGKAAKTRPEQTGELTLSMLRGEEGKQARELDDLLAFLKTQPAPDVLCLSNALLLGLARKLKAQFKAPVLCFLAGEESFLDALPEKIRPAAWKTLAERAEDVDLFISSSQFYSELMRGRLGLPSEKIQVVYNGISTGGYSPPLEPPYPPALGFFTRMCPDKGLDTLVEAFILLRQRNRVPELKLRIGGACTPLDEPFVSSLRERLRSCELLEAVEFFPNVDRETKLKFLHSLSVFSVPARYNEAFGLYLLEAWAAGVPVVQPRHAAFPELIESTGGGLLCEPNDPKSLADAVEALLTDTTLARNMAAAGRKAVLENFTSHAMAEQLVRKFNSLLHSNL